MDRLKIFVSYTTRDGDVSLKLLSRLTRLLNSEFYVFVDILHNDSNNPQKRVFDELKKANIIILIKSKALHTSEWVRKELELAKIYNTPIIPIYISDILDDKDKVMKKVKLFLNYKRQWGRFFFGNKVIFFK